MFVFLFNGVNLDFLPPKCICLICIILFFFFPKRKLKKRPDQINYQRYMLLVRWSEIEVMDLIPPYDLWISSRPTFISWTSEFQKCKYSLLVCAIPWLIRLREPKLSNPTRSPRVDREKKKSTFLESKLQTWQCQVCIMNCKIWNPHLVFLPGKVYLMAFEFKFWFKNFELKWRFSIGDSPRKLAQKSIWCKLQMASNDRFLSVTPTFRLFSNKQANDNLNQMIRYLRKFPPIIR